MIEEKDKAKVLTIEGWVEMYHKYKRYFWGVLGTIALIVIIIIVKPKSSKESNIIDDTDFIERAIQLYEDSTGRKIYPTGRQCIRIETIKRRYKTIDEVIKLLEENEKYM